MKKYILSLFIFCPLLAWGQNVLQLQSPDKTTTLLVTIADELTISMEKNGTTVLSPSAIGMNIRHADKLGELPVLKKVIRRTVNSQSIPTPIYKKSAINEEYNELTAYFKGNYAVCFRCYDQGVAYRFLTDYKAKEIFIDNEKANYSFPEGTQGYAAYSRTDGTVTEQFFNSFENPYVHKPLSELDSQRLIYFPFLVELPGNIKVCITESDLQDYPGMFLLSNPKTFSMQGVFAPVPKTTAQGYWNKQHQEVKERYDYIARTSGKRTFPWRIFCITGQDSDLLNNDLVYLLASPSKLTDTSWIKPGKVAWDWWNDWNLTVVDFRSGVNNETYKYYIDFAARNGIEYVILDDGWAMNGDMMQVTPNINLPELIAYGKVKNIGLILWGGFWSLHVNPEQLIKHYAELGIKGFKIDFMDRDDQTMVNFMWDVAQLAADHQMLIDYHGTCKPFGLQRTFPNVINFEGVNGLEQMKWMDEKYDQVMYDLEFPFIRMLAGPVDYTQGAMRNAVKNNYRPIYTEPMSQGTRCRQLAEYIVFESPLNMLCDAPTHYIKNQECTDFMTSVPTVWDETHPLDSKISNYINIARRKGDVWYIGGINNWEMREMMLDFSFLPAGSYQIELFSDGINADRNASDYKKEIKTISADKQLKVKMYPGGGYAARISKSASLKAGNPVFDGWYADPEAVIFENKYWIFPTHSAPFEQQVYMDAFSSPDLVTWTKHEQIIDTVAVKWAKKAMWAPSILKKDNRYFLFFGANDMYHTGEGGIGVAAADKPEGPYKDYLGRPLIDSIINGAQPIDQFVFQDVDGTYYMYYGGWRHCNVGKLKNDFTGFVPFSDGSLFKEVTPENYVEGPFMFMRNGKYYFMWSEGDWTKDNYCAAYAIADAPIGPFKRIGKILESDVKIGTGAGHHSVIHESKSDKYYIVYHRHPLRATDGNNREVCIDEMHFDDKGFILPVVMTTEGVKANQIY